jgi:hypothetical protein
VARADLRHEYFHNTVRHSSDCLGFGMGSVSRRECDDSHSARRGADFAGASLLAWTTCCVKRTSESKLPETRTMRERLWPDIRGASDVCLRWLAERWGICSHREDYRKCASHRFGIDQGRPPFTWLRWGRTKPGRKHLVLYQESSKGTER